jgi:hypothetical protein
MFNPPNSHPIPGSYAGLLQRLTRRVLQTGVDDRIVELLQQAFESQLEREGVVLSRPERVRLYRQISKSVLTEVLGRVGSA